MEKMLIPLLDTVIDPDGFTAVTVDGQLRSDLIRIYAAKADGYRLWEQGPLHTDEAERCRMTPEIAKMLSRDRSGRWEFYAVQLFDKERLLFSAARQGTELMLFHLPEERVKEVAAKIAKYDEVSCVKTFPMPADTLALWARRVV